MTNSSITKSGKVFSITAYLFKGMVLLSVNKEINELSKCKDYLGNVLTICRINK